MRPSSHTTIDATVSLPWIVEMSKHSIRRGSVGQPEHRAQRLERLEVGGGVLVEPGAVRQLRVARRQLHHAPAGRRAAAGHAHAPPGRADSHCLHCLLLVDLHGQVELRGRHAPRVELRDGGRHDAVLAAGSASASITSSTRSTTRPSRIAKICTTAARPHLDAEHVAVDQPGGRDFLLPLRQRLHRPHRVAVLRRLLESLRGRRPPSCGRAAAPPVHRPGPRTASVCS